MDVIPQNVHWLVPEESAPCDIFVHFRGQFPQAMSSGQLISSAILEKLVKTNSLYIYIRRSDVNAWESWAAKRHEIRIPAQKNEEADPTELYGNKRSELLSYLFKTFQKRNNSPELDQALKHTKALLQKVIQTPMLDWYFEKFHEPPLLFQHNGRVAFSLSVFSFLHKTINEAELENLLFATLVHELDGDPATSMNTVVSQRTLESLEKSRHPVPEQVIAVIRMQDELFSGKGFPNNKMGQELPATIRIFALFNHLDHYRLRDGNSRRARFEHAKQQMTARKGDYDPALWDSFWAFWEKELELVG